MQVAGKIVAGSILEYLLAGGAAAGAATAIGLQSNRAAARNTPPITTRPGSRFNFNGVTPRPRTIPHTPLPRVAYRNPYLREEKGVSNANAEAGETKVSDADLRVIRRITRLDIDEIKSIPEFLEFARLSPAATLTEISNAAELDFKEQQALAPFERATQYTRNVVDVQGLLTSVPELREAMNDVGSFLERPQAIGDFAQILVRRGMNANRLMQGVNRAREIFGDSARMQAIVRRWVVNTVLPAAASSAATYLLRQLYAVFREFKGGIAEVDKETTTRELMAARADVDGQDDDDGNDSGVFSSGLHTRPSLIVERDDAPEDGEFFSSGVNDRAKRGKFMRDEFERLNGSVANIPATDDPLGVVDKVIPKSAPTLPPSTPTGYMGPAGDIFTPNFEGDRLSERPDQPSANVRKSTIPLPPVISRISPAQSYMALEHVQPPPPAPMPSVPAQTLKRKSDMITPGQDAFMTTQVTCVYDANSVPALPGGVTGNTSQNWRDYEAPYGGYNVPLTEAPNLVGIGYDAETMERKMAEGDREGEEVEPEHTSAQTNDKEHQQPAPPADTDKPPSGVNAANETNPAVANKGKPPPNKPLSEPVPTHIRY
jgi:hypothetical protein